MGAAVSITRLTDGFGSSQGCERREGYAPRRVRILALRWVLDVWTARRRRNLRHATSDLAGLGASLHAAGLAGLRNSNRRVLDQTQVAGSQAELASCRSRVPNPRGWQRCRTLACGSICATKLRGASVSRFRAFGWELFWPSSATANCRSRPPHPRALRSQETFKKKLRRT